MKLIITDKGYPSTGIVICQYEVEAPFNDDHRDIEELDLFRRVMIEIYSEFALGKVTAIYDFEYKQMENLLT